MNIQEPLYKAINKDYGYLTFTTPLEVQDEINDLIKEIDPQTNGKGPLWSYAHIENQWSKPTPKILKQFILDLSSNFNYQDNLLNNGYLEDYYGLFYENKPDIVVGENIWFNFQKKYEYIAPHNHDGTLHYVIFHKIPYTLEDEKLDQPLLEESQHKNSNGNFYFIQPGSRNVQFQCLDIDKKWENIIILFPACLTHMTFPFYSSDEYKITVNGSLYFKI